MGSPWACWSDSVGFAVGTQDGLAVVGIAGVGLCVVGTLVLGLVVGDVEGVRLGVEDGIVVGEPDGRPGTFVTHRIS